MPVLTVRASTNVPAPAALVYDLIADYRVGHPSILPPQYFQDLVVEEGGKGAGTLIRYTVLSYGTRQVARARVTEPEPGHILVETDERTGTETRFIVESLGEASARVTFETHYQARGLRGWIEALLVPRYLRQVYAAELALLVQRAAPPSAVGAAGRIA
jgi:hypothetical protein